MTTAPSRDDNETTTRRRRCPVCAATFIPIRRQTYCGNPCRQAAWRRRHAVTRTIDIPFTPPAARQTIYLCTDCDTRYLGEQWCHDCTRPCRRLGPGGECGCGELLTITELLGGDPMA